MRYLTAFALISILCSTLSAQHLCELQFSRSPHRGGIQETLQQALGQGEPGQLWEPARPRKKQLNLKKSTLGQLFLPDTVIGFGSSDTTRYTYTYDSNGNRLTEVVEQWDTAGVLIPYRVEDMWIYGSYRSAWTYDAWGNRLTYLTVKWDGTEWVNGWHHTYTYDASGCMLTDLWENWNGTEWVNSIRDTRTYDVAGKKLAELQEYWDGLQWVPMGYRYTYTYDASGNLLIELVESWEGTQWANIYRITYTYDTSGNMLTRLQESWIGMQWVIVARYTFTFDGNGNCLSGSFETWNGTQWVNIWRDTTTYDGNGNRLTYMRESWNGTQWVPIDGRYTYTYDANGNLLLELQEWWEGTQWVNTVRYIRNYDSHRNVTLVYIETWSGVAWLPASERQLISVGEKGYLFNGCQITLHYIGITTSVATQLHGLPMSYQLGQNYPNPFNPTTVISYQLPGASSVRLSVFDMLGREVSVLVDERKEAGYHEVRFDGSGLASGVYLYRLQTGDFVQTRKLLLLR